jgi:hypothetical protein
MPIGQYANCYHWGTKPAKDVFNPSGSRLPIGFISESFVELLGDSVLGKSGSSFSLRFHHLPHPGYIRSVVFRGDEDVVPLEAVYSVISHLGQPSSETPKAEFYVGNGLCLQIYPHQETGKWGMTTEPRVRAAGDECAQHSMGNLLVFSGDTRKFTIPDYRRISFRAGCDIF